MADSQVGAVTVKSHEKAPRGVQLIGKVEIYTKEDLHVAGAPWG